MNSPQVYSAGAMIGLTQGPSGHVHSPWFTFPHDREQVDYGGRDYQDVKHASVGAFSSALSIPHFEVIVSEKIDNDTGERWWRLGTRKRCALPRHSVEADTIKLSLGVAAIDV